MPSAKPATVQEASPSPPPLPPGPIPSSSAGVVDVPIASLGEGSDDEDGDEGDEEKDDAEDENEDEEWHPSEERLPGSKGKGKAKASSDPGEEKSEGGEEGQAHPWQAVWSADKNGTSLFLRLCEQGRNAAWYFWNTQSGEVTWTNPLDPSASSAEAAPPLPPGPPPPTDGPGHAQRRFGGIPEIDPDLAYLLPANQRGGVSDPASAEQSAQFNARTGRFTNNDYAYNVDHLDGYNKEKRLNSRYFDQDKWERERMIDNAKRKRDEEMGVEPKKITKKDMERFKKKKLEKRLRSQAWLRD